MKIAPRAVEAYLGRPEPHHRALLLYGPDSGLVRERAKKISQLVLGGTDDPFALTEFTEARLQEDPALLADELAAVSLMSPKRVVMIRGAGDKMTKVIEAAASAFHESVFLIVCADELNARSSLRGWFEKENNCGAIACYRDEARDVQQVIHKTFDAAGMKVDRDVIEYLTQQLGNDRYVTYQELEKIITYAGEEKKVTLEEARALVDYNRETNVDDLVNALADKNIRTLERMLTLMQREGTSPVMYLRALQRYFNRLYLVRTQMASGQSAEQAIGSLRPPVFFRQVPIMARHASHWSLVQITKALKLLVEAELACKTSDLPPLPASSRKLFQVTQIR